MKLSQLEQLNSRILVLTLSISTAFFGAVKLKAENSPCNNSTCRPAWTWSVDERLAERFNPAASQARSTAHKIHLGNFIESAPVHQPVTATDFGAPEPTRTDIVYGNETPELFLVWELFDQLINLGFSTDATDREAGRSLVEDRAAALGLGSDMWQRLESAAHQLLVIRREEERAGKASINFPENGASKQVEAIRLCQVRANGIAAAKEEFGEEEFLNLLYRAVAPTFSRSYLVKGTLAAELRFVEGGCK